MGILTSIGKAVAGDALGNVLKVAALPVAFTVAVTAWHQLTKAREETRQIKEAALVNRGRQQCISEVELATAKAIATRAQERAQQAEVDAAAAIKLSEEVRGDEERIKVELQRVSAIADRNAAECGPDRRLSDGVLELIGRDQGGAGKGGSRKGQ